MSVDRHFRSEEIFQAALERAPHERKRFVRRACGNSVTLYREVLSLLELHEGPSFIDEPLVSLDRQNVNKIEIISHRLTGSVQATSGRYDIIEVLGEGGMGIVYLAEQKKPIRRRVALKVVKLGIDSKEGTLRFESERQALALMNHPNIARAYEAGSTEDGRLFFAMEYVPGPPITEYCDSAQLPIRDRLRIFIDVCNAVQHAHQNGIIHRDIKPSNVLINTNSEVPTPKIIDFGVAKAINQRLVEQTLYTHHGIILGSLEYMSPEQADFRIPDIDTRSDIYSMGVLLYELLVGELPIDVSAIGKHGYTEIERRIREDEPPLASRKLEDLGSKGRDAAIRRSTNIGSLSRELRGDLDWIVRKALEKDRFRRYASASEFAADIKRYLNDELVLAGPPSARYRFRKFVRRNRQFVIGATAVLVALTLGLATSTWLFVQNRKAASIAQQQRDDILRLSDLNRLNACIADASRLFPPHPEKIPEMEAWLGGTARELANRLPRHRETLRALKAGAVIVAGDGITGRYRFDNAELQFHHDTLARLVAELERFTDPDPHVGTIASVRDRLEFARRVRYESIDAHRPEWDEAIASIANPDECPLYGGLHIEPQIGLVPIGRDPESGLWEFAHLRSGRIATRASDGRIQLTEANGLVFILVPGGCFQMGSTPPADSSVQPAVISQYARDDEYPSHKVCLDPFFISKYEMTQAQWVRVTGENPSAFTPGNPELTIEAADRQKLSPLLPVERLHWNSAYETMQLIGLSLPTEAQWEYTAKAGTNSIWPWGNDKSRLARAANLKDQSRLRGGGPRDWLYEPWDDGSTYTSTVGRYEANPFGLHDVIGNVWEWCEDGYGLYGEPIRPGDGLRLTRSVDRVLRGGDYDSGAFGSTVTRRVNLNPVHRNRIGVRPARPLFFHADGAESTETKNSKG